MDSSPKKTMEKRKEDSNFKKKHINHSPQEESAKAVFKSSIDKETFNDDSVNMGGKK